MQALSGASEMFSPPQQARGLPTESCSPRSPRLPPKGRQTERLTGCSTVFSLCTAQRGPIRAASSQPPVEKKIARERCHLFSASSLATRSLSQNVPIWDKPKQRSAFASPYLLVSSVPVISLSCPPSPPYDPRAASSTFALYSASLPPLSIPPACHATAHPCHSRIFAHLTISYHSASSIQHPRPIFQCSPLPPIQLSYPKMHVLV